MRDVPTARQLSGVALRTIHVHGPAWLREVADATTADPRGLACKLDVSTDPVGCALTEAGWTEVAEGRWRDPYTRRVLPEHRALERIAKDNRDNTRTIAPAPSQTP